ncbi:hypothetical protein ACJJTC_007273 [Scirpophaga incertulas]
MLHLFLAMAACVAAASAGTLPPYFTPCSASDPDLDQCIEKVISSGGPQFTDGIPALDIAPLDPMSLGRLVINNPALKLTFTDTVVTGLKGFRLNSYRMHADRNKATIDVTANVTVKAHYVIDGKILILPIRGSGPAKIKITNLNIVIKYDFDTRDGHWVVTNYKDSYKMDHAYFKFNNLFNGNKELGDTLHKVMNDNWEPVIRDIAPVAFQEIIKVCVDECKKLFAAVPTAELLRL